MTKKQGEITVSGTGRVSVRPDVADIRLGVQLSRESVGELRDEAARIMGEIVGTLEAGGVPKSDIQTRLLAVQPRYAYHENEPPQPAGYEMTNTVEVTVRDLSRLTDVIDAALKAGATSMDGLNFRLADPAPADKNARKLAMAEAHSRAEILAEAARVTIDGVTSVIEDGAAAPPRPFVKGERMVMAADASTPVESGSLEMAVRVSVTYRTSG